MKSTEDKTLADEDRWQPSIWWQLFTEDLHACLWHEFSKISLYPKVTTIHATYSISFVCGVDKAINSRNLIMIFNKIIKNILFFVKIY